MAGSGMKSLVKDTAIYGLSSILGRFLNWGLTPLYTYTFLKGEYGIVSNIYGITAVLFVLLTYGMETGFFRFMNKDDEKLSTVYSTSLITLGGSSLLFFLLCFVFVEPISSWMDYKGHNDYILIMAAVVSLDAFMTIPYAYLRYKKRPIRFATIRIVFIFSNILFNLFFLLVCPSLFKTNPDLIAWFYNPSYGIGYIFVSNLISTIIALLMLLPCIFGIQFSFDKVLLNRMLRYSFPLLILGIAGVINQTIAPLIYPYIYDTPELGREQLGIYSACLKITVVITMFTQAFRYAYEPFIFSQNKENDNTLAYAKAMKYFVIFALVIFLSVIFYIDILKYFISVSYREGLSIVPIAMLGEIFFGIYFNLSVWYKLKDKTSFGARFSILGCIITVLINFIFVPICGYIASAWATFFCNLIIMSISYYFGQKYYPIKYDLKNYLFYTILTAILYVAGMLPHIDNEIIRLTYRTILLMLFIAVIIKKDLPLSEIPVINKYFKKKN